jgi:LysM repeat protein
LPLDVANFSNYQGYSNASMGANSGGFVSGVAGTPAGPGLPELGAKMPYIVRSGDTFSNISIRIYGSGSKAVELAENTGVGKNDMIFPGDIIYYQLTRESLSFAGRYESLARQEVIIQEGDTLSKIAYKFYGSHKKWRGIWRANNQIKDPDMLKVGEKIFVITKEAYASLDKRHDNASESITASLTSEKINEISDVIKSDASKLNTKNQVNNILTANEADEEMLLKGLEENSSLKNRVLEMDLGLDLDPEIFEEDGELKVSKRQNWEEQIPNWGV